jgi:hypothetical protein
MQNGQRLRLTRSAMAIALREERHVAIMIPEGAVIDVMDGPFNGSRLMDVRYEGEMIMMFDFGILNWPSSAFCCGPPRQRTGTLIRAKPEAEETRWTGAPKWSYLNRSVESMSSA